mmetsp:Transcript_30799/g.77929  ORF Transcript_30799/g.77929 Transcript_30799/m.77929 type:complete len:219 (-) Transcript_30799:4323-4979(-)
MEVRFGITAGGAGNAACQVCSAIHKAASQDARVVRQPFPQQGGQDGGMWGCRSPNFKSRVFRPWDRHQSRYKEGVWMGGGGGEATHPASRRRRQPQTLHDSTRVRMVHSEGGGEEQEGRRGVVAGKAAPQRAPLQAPLPAPPGVNKGSRRSAGHRGGQCGREVWAEAPPEGREIRIWGGTGQAGENLDAGENSPKSTSRLDSSPQELAATLPATHPSA